jgi:hypothetical protein
MEECGVVLRNVVIGPTLNVVRPEQDYHYVVVCCIGTITEVGITAVLESACAICDDLSVLGRSQLTPSPASVVAGSGTRGRRSCPSPPSLA